MTHDTEGTNGPAGAGPLERRVGRPAPKRAKPLHARLSSARQLLIDWRNVLRRSGPTTEQERAGFDGDMAMFDAAIKAVAEARDREKAGACWCATCDRKAHLFPSRMSLCPKCGDKRCPRAEHHRNACGRTNGADWAADMRAKLERQCCGTLHGSRHRANCPERKPPNV